MQTAQFVLHSRMEERHWWFRARRRIACELIRRVEPPSRERVLVDIGCGTGGNLAALAGEYTCVGYDPSPEAIGLAQKRLPQVRFLSGDLWAALEQIPSTARFFLLMDVLEHLPDDFLFLSELLSRVQAGSHLLITVPADQTLWSPHDVSFGHYRRYDRGRFEQLWEGLPVTPRLVSYYNSRLSPLARMARKLSRWRGKAGGEAGTDFSLPPVPVNRLLEAVFAGETGRLSALLEGRAARGFSAGVSLIALVRREAGVIRPRCRPGQVPADSLAREA